MLFVFMCVFRLGSVGAFVRLVCCACPVLSLGSPQKTQDAKTPEAPPRYKKQRQNVLTKHIYFSQNGILKKIIPEGIGNSNSRFARTLVIFLNYLRQYGAIAFCPKYNFNLVGVRVVAFGTSWPMHLVCGALALERMGGGSRSSHCFCH